MLTTVVGSYPTILQDPKSISSKISDFFGAYDRYVPALKLAVSDQLEAGIDIISDGQVRGDMIDVFARAIPGMTVEDGTPKIVGKIMPANHSLGASDLKLALKTARSVSEDFNEDFNNGNSKLFTGDKFNENFKGIKGIITGPTTLVLSCRAEGFYNRDKKEAIVADMALALKKEAHELQKAGADIIQIDEPFLSTGVVDMSAAKKAVKTITEELKVPVSMHVCGDVGDVLSELLKFKVQILDCEFAGVPSNIQALENTPIKSKKIGLGCIDTKKEQVDELENVVKFIKKGIDIIGEENMIVDPDCGMRMLSRNAALLKLKKMKEAVEWLC